MLKIRIDQTGPRLYVAYAEHDGTLRADGVSAAQALMGLFEVHAEMLDCQITFRRLANKQKVQRVPKSEDRERPLVPAWAVEMIKGRRG